MRNSKALYQYLVSHIQLNESKTEVERIAYTLLEFHFNLNQTQIIADVGINPDATKIAELEEIIARVNRYEPVQYIIGEAIFFGRSFSVSPAVLIPRPETEELVAEVLKYIRARSMPVEILDIGTGSGCIPITLALENNASQVHATDVSVEALVMAKKNAHRLNASVNFYAHDILNDPLNHRNLDVVISNPPYIARQEITNMQANVTRYEPHLALFVPDENPLLFYTAISCKALKSLRPEGMLIVEINEKYGDAVANCFLVAGYHEVEIITDISQKPRMVKGIKR